MRLLCLTKYTRQGPSSRYRVYHFLPYLERAGIDVEVQTLHDDGYLDRMFCGKRPSPAYLFGRWTRRAAALIRARRYDLVFIQKELFPWLPDVFETLLRWTGVDFVLDFDDAIFVPYENLRFHPARAVLRNKLPRVIQKSCLVLAGNEYLADYARRYSSRVVRFPTVVDTGRFVPAETRAAADLPVVGWIGSPETVGFIEDLRGTLQTLAEDTPYELRLVGAVAVPMEGVRVTSRPWSEAGEIEELQGFDVGIMPLGRSRWAQGKCGLKLLQYMSCGVASVSSPMGSAVEIVENGVNGFLAGSPVEWADAVGRLLRDPHLRKTLARRGRETVKEGYSLDRAGPRLANLLLEARGRTV